ncbi:Uncharacterised protein [Streptococcus pasteurianus]|nr:Uncharacterised protein [Streptococcus pasteurianus]
MMQVNSQKYAIVDLEATGAHAMAEIIQVGIVIIENDEIVKTYQTDVNPHEALTEHIINLTGITDEQLAKAPDFSQVAQEIFSLITHCVFVAHNVKFDANLLAEQLFMEDYELRTPRVDTVELAQVFYPTFEKYSLGNLADALALDLADAHTAISDAYATAQLFLKLKAKMKSLPKEVLESLLPLADNLLFETGMLIEESFKQAKVLSPKDFQEVGGLVLRQPKTIGETRQLSEAFDVNLALLGLDAREKQSQFAQLVKDDFQSSQVSFLEAQAGLGVAYGYLLPLLQLAQDEQVIVSVPTKVLQDQIMANEVRKIQDVFHIPCQSIKGPGNYIKLDAFADSLRREGDNRLVNRYKMQLLVWLTETETGDLDEIKQKQRFEAYFDQIKHDGNLSEKSLYKDVDFWNRTYENAKHSKLLIINHAYFLERVQDDKAFAAKKVLVFDEAQKLILNLEQFSRRRVNVTQLVQKLEKHLDAALPTLEKRLIESLSFQLSHLATRFYQNQEVYVTTEDARRLEQATNELLAFNPDWRYICLEDLLALFAQPFTDFWFETIVENEKRQTYLNASIVELLNFQEFLPETRKTYMISATLHISPQVSLADLLGFEHYHFMSIAHDKQNAQHIWIDEEMPNVADISEEEYASAIAERIYQLKQLDEPILVLFNAKKTMLDVSDLLDDMALHHLTQEKNGTAYNVKRRFERGESRILLGTGAFWEGVDFVQADKIIEVITRLPFENPKDLFVQKISNYLLAQAKSPFYDYSLPLAILKLKQAIGRTMRRDNQRSAVLILDNRILTKSYGKMINDALAEEFYLSSQKFSKSLTEIKNFLL